MKSLYFSHDCNASADPKVLKLINKYGYEGYGIYWRLLEYLYTQDGLLEDYNLVITMLFPNYNQVITMLDYMIELQLFCVDEKFRLYSKRLLDTINLQVSKHKKLSQGGKKGMKSRYLNDNQVITKLQPGYNQVITKEREIEREIEREKEIKKKEYKEKKSTETPTHKYQFFIFEKCENIRKLKNQLTEKEADNLEANFTHQEIMDVLAAMENKTDLSKKYQSVYLTALTWLKMRRKDGK
jgi:hypothetical protein